MEYTHNCNLLETQKVGIEDYLNYVKRNAVIDNNLTQIHCNMHHEHFRKIDILQEIKQNNENELQKNRRQN